jgi:predicted amidohydrolase
MTFQIALVQFSPVRKSVTTNINNISRLLDGIKADLIVLPELSNSGYLYNSSDSLLPYCEPSDGSGDFLSALINTASRTGGVIVAGYAERDNHQIYNAAAALSSTGVIDNYRKTHLYSTEKYLFHPGNSGFKTFLWKQVSIGLMVCFDWIFPESARSLAIAGAQVIAHPANLVMPYCQDAMVTRSIENKVFTITANRIGIEKLKHVKLAFTGQSQMTSPTGEILYRGPVDKPTVNVMTIVPDDALDKHISDENDLFNDRRVEYYINE